MTRLTPEQARELLDRPYVACCGDCDTHLHCGGDYAPDHRGTHTRVERDVHDLAREVIAAHEERDAAQHAARAAQAVEREAATEEAAAQRDVDDDPSEVHITAYEAAAYTHAEARAATDALLAGAAPASAGRLVANAMHWLDATFYENARGTEIDPTESDDNVKEYLDHWRDALVVPWVRAGAEARAERDALRTALDGLRAAVLREREAQEAYEAARNGSTFDLRAYVAACDAAKLRHFDATAALDALLSAAPPPATVPAALVRRQIGAVLAANGCDCDCGHSSDEHDDDCDRCLACRIEGTLDAALAGCA